MNKCLKYLILGIIVFFVSFSFTHAENICENEQNTSCAYCVYEVSKGCYFKFSVTYKGDSTALSYNEINFINSNGSYLNCHFDYTNFIKNDFLDSNKNVICPKLSIDSKNSSGTGRTTNIDVTVKPDIYGNIEANNESFIVENHNDTTDKSNENANDTANITYVCHYESNTIGDFDVNIKDGEVIVNGASKCDSLKYPFLDSSNFRSNRCPDVGVLTSAVDNKRQCSITSNLSASGAILTKGSLLNQDNGEIVDTTREGGFGGSANKTSNNKSPKTDYENLCSNPSSGVRKAFRILGYIVVISKWVAPLIIIVLGIVDFSRASLSDDEKATDKASKALLRRIISGIAIFLVPDIIIGVLNTLEVSINIKENSFIGCTKCLFDPINNCEISDEEN